MNPKQNKDEIQKFVLECNERVHSYNGSEMHETAREFMKASTIPKYSYNFSWLGRPIIQYPQDVIAMQEIIWQTKPDLIIETGIAHGGSLILSASMLAMIDYCEGIGSGKMLDLKNSQSRVVGIDIDIRAHNRAAIEAHPLARKINMIEGSSIAPDIIARVCEYAINHKNILVFLDSMHTHDHVLAELEAYAPLVSPDSYCVVFDTIIEDLPDKMFSDRPWKKGDNPKTAVREFLHRLKTEGRIGVDGAPLQFEIDKMIENKLLITVAPDGFLKRI
jgi:cephalosporin hydroxylase